MSWKHALPSFFFLNKLKKFAIILIATKQIKLFIFIYGGIVFFFCTTGWMNFYAALMCHHVPNLLGCVTTKNPEVEGLLLLTPYWLAVRSASCFQSLPQLVLGNCDNITDTVTQQLQAIASPPPPRGIHCRVLQEALHNQTRRKSTTMGQVAYISAPVQG